MTAAAAMVPCSICASCGADKSVEQIIPVNTRDTPDPQWQQAEIFPGLEKNNPIFHPDVPVLPYLKKPLHLFSNKPDGNPTTSPMITGKKIMTGII